MDHPHGLLDSFEFPFLCCTCTYSLRLLRNVAQIYGSASSSGWYFNMFAHMALVSFHPFISQFCYCNSTNIITRITIHSGAVVHKNLNKTAANNVVSAEFHPPSCSDGQPIIGTTSFFSSKSRQRERGLLLVPLNAKNSGLPGDEEDPRALETVLKLYSAIKNKNIRELSEIIGDECQCVCNFFSIFQPLRGKKVYILYILLDFNIIYNI